MGGLKARGWLLGLEPQLPPEQARWATCPGSASPTASPSPTVCLPACAGHAHGNSECPWRAHMPRPAACAPANRRKPVKTETHMVLQTHSSNMMASQPSSSKLVARHQVLYSEDPSRCGRAHATSNMLAGLSMLVGPTLADQHGLCRILKHYRACSSSMYRRGPRGGPRPAW